jgi:hypothetical protein
VQALPAKYEPKKWKIEAAYLAHIAAAELTHTKKVSTTAGSTTKESRLV